MSGSSDMTWGDWIGVIVVFALGWFLGFLTGGNGATNYEYNQAIEAGAGEYYLDENHERQFRWVVPEPKPAWPAAPLSSLQASGSGPKVH